MSKITLVDVANLENENTAVATMASNNSALRTAVDNTLSRDGTSPNQMGAAIDMNSNHILNLPQPLTNAEPLRLADLNSFVGGGTVTNIPIGGTTGQVLAKTSNTNYLVQWQDEVTNLTAGTNIVLTGTTPTTIATSTTPTFTTVNKVTLTAPTTGSTLTIADGKTATINNTLTFTGTDASSVAFGAGGTVGYIGSPLSQFAATTSAQLISTISDETGTGSLVFATSPTLVTPILGVPTSGTLTNCTGLPISTGVSGLAAGVAAFLATPSSANLKAATTDETGSGALVFANTPTLVTPVLGAATATTINGSTVSPGHYSGEPSTGSASAGEIGEYVESVVASGSAVALTNNTDKDVTTITLSAGDWDVDAIIYFLPAGSPSVTTSKASLSTTLNTSDTTVGRFTQIATPANTNVAIQSTPIPPYRWSVSGSTTLHLVALSIFSAGTMGAYGLIRARRAR